MKRQGRRTDRATRKDNTSERQDEPIRKSYNLRKRKCETEQNDQDKSMENGNTKRKCLKKDNQRTSNQHEMPARGQKFRHTKMGTSKEKQPQPCIHNKETLLTQPLRRNISQKTQPMGTRRLTRLSMTSEQNSKRKTSDSNLQLMQRKTQVKEEHLSRTNRNKNRTQKTLRRTPKSGKKRLLQQTLKPMLTLKAPQKEIISNTKQKAQTQSRGGVSENSNLMKEGHIEQSNEAKHRRISKPKVIKQHSRKAARKSAPKAHTSTLFPTRGRTPTKNFSSLFLKKIDTKFYPKASDMSHIHGLSVSNDNLIWVNHLGKCVQLLNSSGEVLRTIDLDHSPVFSCCTPSGDLLETQAYAAFAKPVITLISRDGNIRVLADLSSYASNLCGILCENERIFVVGYSTREELDGARRSYLIIELSMGGEVERVYNTNNDCDDINNIISLNGQVIALRTNRCAMIPLRGEIISSEKVNEICIECVYSASASIDNLGNVILGAHTELMIIDPSLKFMHKIDAGVGSIISTAVDKNNQLWLGTTSGGLYSAQYLN